MNLKKYIGLLLFAMTLLLVSQQNVNVPNQEIIVQFSDVELSSDAVQNTLSSVKTDLETIGVSEIQVSVNDESSLKITYYSKLDSELIKNLLTNKGYSSSKKSSDENNHDDSIAYNLDVFDIRKPNHTKGDFQGIVLDLKSESDRFQNPKKYKPSLIYNSKESKFVETETSAISFSFELAIQDTSRKIPESRAGPLV